MQTNIQTMQGASGVVDMQAYRTAVSRRSTRLGTPEGSGTGRSHYGLVETGAALEELWADYKRTSTSDIRDQLIVHYWPLVKYVASRVAKGLPQTVDEADLVSYGMFGLIDAIEKFDLLRDLKFETYAVVRIRGAIIDELRKADWVPRSVRAKARWVDQAQANLESRLGRTPTSSEIAAELGMSDAEFRHVRSRSDAKSCVSLHGELSGSSGQGGESTTLVETISDPGAGPEDVFENEEVRQIVAGSIAGLADREKTVLTLYYYQQMTLAQIGKHLGLTESRVCQIHSKAIMQLRNRLAGLRESA
jgi:RNA polymerase sigma factor for flagellar operon FliA